MFLIFPLKDADVRIIKYLQKIILLLLFLFPFKNRISCGNLLLKPSQKISSTYLSYDKNIIILVKKDGCIFIEILYFTLMDSIIANKI